jgi:hypothetical protein
MCKGNSKISWTFDVKSLGASAQGGALATLQKSFIIRYRPRR